MKLLTTFTILAFATSTIFVPIDTRIYMMHKDVSVGVQMGVYQVITDKLDTAVYYLWANTSGGSLRAESKVVNDMTLLNWTKCITYRFKYISSSGDNISDWSAVFKLMRISNEGILDFKTFHYFDSLPSNFVADLYRSIFCYNPVNEQIRMPRRSGLWLSIVYGMKKGTEPVLIGDSNNLYPAYDVGGHQFDRVSVVIVDSTGEPTLATYKLKYATIFSRNTLVNKVIIITLIVFVCLLPIGIILLVVGKILKWV